MEPKQPFMNLPPRPPEMPSANNQEFGGNNSLPEVYPGSGQNFETSQEQMPAPQERLQVPVQTAPSIPLMPDVPTAPQPAKPVPPQVDDTPTVANDDDLIEKEWIEKAKRVLAETKEDPALRETEIKKLQLDYIRKRYGREIGETTD